jgi:hypothetical protein
VKKQQKQSVLAGNSHTDSKTDHLAPTSVSLAVEGTGNAARGRCKQAKHNPNGGLKGASSVPGRPYQLRVAFSN